MSTLALRQPVDLRRWYRPAMVGLTVVILLAAVAVGAASFGAFASAGALGIDKATHDAFAARWWATGSMYLPAQLAGPFVAQPLPHVPAVMPSMYPPTAVLLFAPFAVLPAVLWWAVPLAAIAWTLAQWRPAPWTWPLLALALLYPPTLASVWAGNTTMWMVAGIAVGLRYGWAGPLLLLKPSLAPFALAGVWRRSWWVGLAVLAVVSLPLLGEWIAYVSVVGNAETSIAYSLGSVPILLVPVVAWGGRRT